MKKKYTSYLSLGTNQGNKLQNLQNAINEIEKKVGVVHKTSYIYETPSWGFNGNDFYNICIQITTELEPETLLKSLLKIENELGRIRLDKNGYQNRNIDIDILLIDDKTINSKTLIVPHPNMLNRKFVMMPLIEIAKEIIHPIANKTLNNCLQICDDISEIKLTSKKVTTSKHKKPS